MKIVFTLLIFVTSFSISAQTISEQLGGVSCNFEIHSDTTKLNVIKQLLIERPKVGSKVSEIENESYAYAYAYSEWCLEFVTNTKITSKKWASAEEKKQRGAYKITARDSTGAVLVSQYIGKNNVRLWKGKKYFGDMYTYSLNLAGLPLIILDDIAKIEIVLVF